MQNGKSTVQGLFDGNKIFSVPKYQRAYTWTRDNLEDFLNDLLNQRGDKSYFFGTFLFHKKERRQVYELFDVVDGQQRITTVMIFMQCIIKQLKEYDSEKISDTMYEEIYIKDHRGNFKLELENEDNGFLHSYILGDNTRNHFETPSQKQLHEAKLYFEKAFASYAYETLERMFDVATNADVLLYVVNDISDATQIFELLNDRGKKLTDLEAIKSFLMYKIGCLNLNHQAQIINDIQDNFASIYRIVESIKINETDVLRYHTIAFDDGVEDKEIRTEIQAYVNRLTRSFNIFKAIHSNEMKCNDLDRFFMIGRVGPFYPLMMVVYDQHQSQFKEFVSNLIKFTFRAAFIGLKSNGESHFYRYIREKGNLLDAIKWPVDGNWWNINGRVDEFLAFNNFYDWVNTNVVKYILFSYENHLRQQKGHPLLTKDNYFETRERQKLNIEHITAQKAKNLKFTQAFEEKYSHSLGNLVIDTKASNSRKSNKPVSKKKEEYTTAPLISQNEIVLSEVNWDDIREVKTFIKERNAKLITFIKENLL